MLYEAYGGSINNMIMADMALYIADTNAYTELSLAQSIALLLDPLTLLDSIFGIMNNVPSVYTRGTLSYKSCTEINVTHSCQSAAWWWWDDLWKCEYSINPNWIIILALNYAGRLSIYMLYMIQYIYMCYIYDIYIYVLWIRPPLSELTSAYR